MTEPDTDEAKAEPGALDELADAQAADRDNGKASAATRLVALATAHAELFHAPDSVAYATLAIDGHSETWPIRSKRFRSWLARAFYDDEERAPGAQALQDALAVLEGEAIFAGEREPVAVRVTGLDGTIYLDLGDEGWTTIEVDRTGWRQVSSPPVKLRRPAAMAPLPAPVAGGDIEALREFVNVADEADWKLVVAWLVAAMRPTGPYPLLALHGEHGSAKTTLARLLRALVDPSAAPVRADPREPRDLMISASNSHVIALDNLSGVRTWLSDGLCRLSTGGGFAIRELYSDSDEVIFEAQRPVILNGIEELATRGDLLDRALVLYLPTIGKPERRTERDLWSEFEAARPAILGALLDAVSTGLARLDEVHLEDPPRLADFAEWVEACAPALGWAPGEFLDAYRENQTHANALTLEASPIAAAVRAVAAVGFDGTASELLAELAGRVDEADTRKRSWPGNARALSADLRRIQPNMRAEGVLIDFDRDGSRRTIRVGTYSSVTCVIASQPRSQSGIAGDATADSLASPDPALASSASPARPLRHPQSRSQSENDASDANDARSRTSSHRGVERNGDDPHSDIDDPLTAGQRLLAAAARRGEAP